MGAVTASCTNAKLDESSSAAATTTTAATEFGEGSDAATIDPGGGRTGPITSGSSPLKGMKGAAPGIRITEDFRDRVPAVDGTVDDFTGAAEGYDIVMVLAISAESARSDSPGRIADEVISSTEGGRTCLGYHACREFALDNADCDYDGVSGNIDLLANGDPGEAGFAVVEFTGTGALRAVDQVTAQSRPLADRPAGADPIYGPIGNGVLEIGTLLPVMGPDGAAARAALAGAKVAVDEVNNEGGVLGEPVVLVPDESGDGSSSATTEAVRRLIDRPVDAVIGGTVYGITSVAIPELTDAGIILFSPTDTARALSVADDRGLFFRLSPPTDLEGQVLGNLITNDGYTRGRDRCRYRRRQPGTRRRHRCGDQRRLGHCHRDRGGRRRPRRSSDRSTADRLRPPGTGDRDVGAGGRVGAQRPGREGQGPVHDRDVRHCRRHDRRAGAARRGLIRRRAISPRW
ncbi:MAG: ABC transporter substrate-binding protein [Microthrixaceae bacterium]